MNDKIKTLLETVNSAKEQYETAVSKAADVLKQSLSTIVSELDGVEAIRWEQYTPYFNDGDACEFWVNEPRIKFNNTPEDAGDYEDGFIDDYDVKTGKEKEVFEAVYEIFKSIDDNIFLSAFDDHVQVTVTADGVEVDEYEHD